MYEDDLDDYFNENGGFIPAILADNIQLFNQYKTPKTEKGGDIIWHYEKEEGIWKPYGISHVEEEVKLELGLSYKPYMASQVVNCIQVDTYIDREEFVCPLHLIVLQNGTLNMETRTLEEHNSDNYAKNRLSISFYTKAECPAIDKFFKEVYPENQDILYEIIGYCLWKATPIHLFFILLGEGRNGKSTYLNLIKQFLGEGNVSAVALQDLDESRFAIALLYEKMANLNSDIPQNLLKHTGKLKQLSDGSLMKAEFKNQQAFHFANYAKLIFSANTLPITYDDTTAFHRRPVILNFEQEFVDGVNADPDILKKLTTPQELSGLLNRVLEALDRVLKQGGFTNVKSVEERKQEYTIKSNPAKYFLENCVEEGEPQDYVTKSDLYDAYISWCHKNGYTPTSQSALSAQANRWLPYIDGRKKRVGGENVKVWYKIRLNEVAEVAGPPSVTPVSRSPSTGNRNRSRRRWTNGPSDPTLDGFVTEEDPINYVENTPDDEIEKKPQMSYTP